MKKNNFSFAKYLLIFFASMIIGCVFASASFAYYMTTVREVVIRRNPSNKSPIVSTFEQNQRVIVLGKKNGWYLVSDLFEEEKGWVNGKYLKKLDVRKNVEFKTANGIAWGTPHEKIDEKYGLSKLYTEKEFADEKVNKAIIGWHVIEPKRWAYVAVAKEAKFDEDWFKAKKIDIYYLFNKNKKLIGYYFFLMELLGNNDSEVEMNAFDIIENKLKDTQDIGYGDDGFYSGYNFNKFYVSLCFSTYGGRSAIYTVLGVLKK